MRVLITDGHSWAAWGRAKQEEPMKDSKLPYKDSAHLYIFSFSLDKLPGYINLLPDESSRMVVTIFTHLFLAFLDAFQSPSSTTLAFVTQLGNFETSIKLCSHHHNHNTFDCFYLNICFFVWPSLQRERVRHRVREERWSVYWFTPQTALKARTGLLEAGSQALLPDNSSECRGPTTAYCPCAM